MREIKYRQTPKGVLTNIYCKMIERSKLKNIPAPDYTLKEFHQAYLTNQLFVQIYNQWVASGFQYYEKPSIDRKNPERGYTKDNIQIMTWRDNRLKGDAENARRFTTPIVMMDLSNNPIMEFESTKDAVSFTGISQGLITACCQGKRHKTHGYKFKYRGDKFRKTVHDTPTLAQGGDER